MTRWSTKQVLGCLIGSIFFTLGSSLGAYILWNKSKQKKMHSSKYKIVNIVQTGLQKEALQTSYLAELLNLSGDKEVSLYAVDCKKAEEKLLISPLISEAFVKKIPPDTLYIEYEARKPIAYLVDYENIGIDREGYIFPMTPFFSPKEMPEIYLGLPSFGEPEDNFDRKGACWNAPIQNRYFEIALSVFQFLEQAPWKEGFRVKKIDVSNAFAPSLGQREIVLFTEEDFTFSFEGKQISCIFPKILRLAPKDYSQQLNHFFSLRRHMAEDYKKQLMKKPKSGAFQTRIIDFRIPQLAFVENHREP